MKNVIFVVGGPGSGKDILIKQIQERYSIKEYTFDQMLKAKELEQTFIVKGNAYEIDKVLSIKESLENKYYQTHMIFVDVESHISRQRLVGRNINEEVRIEKFNKTKESLIIYER